MATSTRRDFFKTSAALAAGSLAGGLALANDRPGSKMKLGLVTYLWGQDWDLPSLIANCEKSGVSGVETRTTHAHGVEPSLNAKQRLEVKRRFADSPVEFVGPGSNENFDHPRAEKLAAAIRATKAFVKLSHDCGGTGVKVKPNSFHKNVPRQVTIEQIGRSLNKVGAFAADYGQEIRLEVHGQCAPLPIMKQIIDIADHPNVGICWNSNPQDLHGKGLLHNFNLVKDRLGATAHIRELDSDNYPYAQLIGLLLKMDYEGWLLLECSTKPDDRVAALAKQQKVFEEMIAAALDQT